MCLCRNVCVALAGAVKADRGGTGRHTGTGCAEKKQNQPIHLLQLRGSF